MLKKTDWLRGVVGIGLLAASIGAASANITPTFVPPVIDLGGGEFKYVYSVNVDSDQMVQTGDYFVIYDFAGYTGTSSAPSGWTLTTPLAGPIPDLTSPVDDPSILNLKWTYSGSTLSGPQDLGDFSANSSISEHIRGYYAGRGTLQSEMEYGEKAGNAGRTQVPCPTPEPASMALLGMGALPLLRRLRRRTVKNDEA